MKHIHQSPARALDGLRPRVGLGTAGFAGPDDRAALDVLDTWVDLGGRLIDTAAVYGHGRSELTLGRWLRSNRHRDLLVLITKGGHPDERWRSRLDESSIVSDLHASLEHLGVDRIDLFMLHRDDERVPVGELVDILDGQVATGAIAAYGVSNWKMVRIDAAVAYAAKNGRSPVSAVSNYFGLATQVRQMLPGTVSAGSPDWESWLQSTTIPFIGWSALSGGYFGDRTSLVDDPTYDSAANRRLRVRTRLKAEQLGIPASGLALAWVLSRSFKPIALIGTTKVDHLRTLYSIAEHGPALDLDFLRDADSD